MHFTQAVTIFISGELTPSMVDMLMTVAPGLQTSVNAVLISINQCAWINSVFDQRLDGLLSVSHLLHEAFLGMRSDLFLAKR